MWPNHKASGIPEGMHWKTTLFGFLSAVAYGAIEVIAKGATLTDWKTYVLPGIIAGIGYLAGDKDKTTPEP